jgi:transcriptional/translational regulatory protein YebC/TACO1
MLEEKTDNLQDADGKLAIDSIETVQPETKVLEEQEVVEPSNDTILEESIENIEIPSDEMETEVQEQKQEVEKLIAKLEEDDDVVNVFHNMK